MKNKIILLNLILSICYYGCKTIPTFEKEGGLRLVLNISYSDFLRSVSVNDNKQHIEQVLAEIKNEQVKDFDGFITSYCKAEEKIFPGSKLVSVFNKLEWQDKIKSYSTNEEVIQVLKREWQEVLLSTDSIIRKRLADREDIENANIKIENGNTFRVEIPGIKDPERIQSILLTTGELGFWETYNNTEIFQYLEKINNHFAKSKYLQKEQDRLITEKQNDSTVATSASLTSVLEKQKKQKVDSFASTNPLFSLLKPNTSFDGKLTPGSIVGYVQSVDTAEIKRIFQLDSVTYFLPYTCKLVLSKPVQKTDISYFELIALKTDRMRGPRINSGIITNVTAQKENNEYVIEMQMNGEGARSWRQMTAQNISKEIAITMDGVVYMHPVVMSTIESGKSTLTKNFTPEEATDLASILNAGKFPLKLNLVKTEIIKAKQ